MALLHPEKIDDEKEKAVIQRLIRNSPSGADYMVQQLSEGVGMIAVSPGDDGIGGGF